MTDLGSAKQVVTNMYIFVTYELDCNSLDCNLSLINCGISPKINNPLNILLETSPNLIPSVIKVLA